MIRPGAMQYNIEFVGTNSSDNIIDPNKFKRYIRTAMGAIGASAVQNVNRRINEQEWKHQPRTLGRAIRYEASDWGVSIYSDDRIAPHARYQEEGVERHEMRYLLQATSSIPLRIGNVTIFRWATENWMGIPHRFVDPHSGLVMQATGWIHPGYPGKHYFRDGIKDTIREASQRLRGLVIKVARGED
jgi:hypothetical protein